MIIKLRNKTIFRVKYDAAKILCILDMTYGIL